MAGRGNTGDDRTSFFVPSLGLVFGWLIGVRSEKVSRTLGELKRHGIAEFSGATLVIHNKATLERLAG